MNEVPKSFEAETRVSPPGQDIRVLFVALNDDVGAERVPAAMGALGADCAVMSPPGFYCTRTRFVGRRFVLPWHCGAWLGVVFARHRLEAALRTWQPDLIVPLDHIAAQLLRALARNDEVTEGLRRALLTSLGSPDGYAAACRRVGLTQAAAELGIRQPGFCFSNDPDEILRGATRLGYPAVLKQENTCGGHGVWVVGSPDSLRDALAIAFGRTRSKRLRMAARARLWSRLGFGETASLPVILQAFVAGSPAMRTVAAWQGQVLDGLSLVAEHVHPAPTGSSTVVRQTDNAEMADAVRRLVAALGCSGFVSFDFILDEQARQAYLIEMNPRPIATTSLGRLFGHDLCAALLARVGGVSPLPATKILDSDSRVALFPREVERDPGNLDRLRARNLHHAVPHGDPGVLAAYLKYLARVHPKSMPAIRRMVMAGSGATVPRQ